MAREPDDASWLLLQQVADKTTTQSFKKTITAAMLLRAAHPPSSNSVKPRKTSHWLVDCFLGFMGLIVGQHEESLLTLIHHIQV
jgi:hypothetical protein